MRVIQMSDYQVTTATASGLKDNVTLPIFQRGYVRKIPLVKDFQRM